MTTAAAAVATTTGGGTSTAPSTGSRRNVGSPLPRSPMGALLMGEEAKEEFSTLQKEA